jgi:hypothetical protein
MAGGAVVAAPCRCRCAGPLRLALSRPRALRLVRAFAVSGHTAPGTTARTYARLALCPPVRCWARGSSARVLQPGPWACCPGSGGGTGGVGCGLRGPLALACIPAGPALARAWYGAFWCLARRSVAAGHDAPRPALRDRLPRATWPASSRAASAKTRGGVGGFAVWRCVQVPLSYEPLQTCRGHPAPLLAWGSPRPSWPGGASCGGLGNSLLTRVCGLCLAGVGLRVGLGWRLG